MRAAGHHVEALRSGSGGNAAQVAVAPVAVPRVDIQGIRLAPAHGQGLPGRRCRTALAGSGNHARALVPQVVPPPGLVEDHRDHATGAGAERVLSRPVGHSARADHGDVAGRAVRASPDLVQPPGVGAVEGARRAVRSHAGRSPRSVEIARQAGTRRRRGRWGAPPGQAPLLVALTVAAPQDQLGAVPRALTAGVQAEPGLHAGDGAVRVDVPLLVGLAVAVPDDRLGAIARALAGGVEARAAVDRQLLARGGRPALTRPAVAVPQLNLGPPGGARVRDVDAPARLRPHDRLIGGGGGGGRGGGDAAGQGRAAAGRTEGDGEQRCRHGCLHSRPRSTQTTGMPCHGGASCQRSGSGRAASWRCLSGVP